MTQVTMKALDTIHISSVGPDNIVEGQQFEINETEAKQLEERGLAKRVTGKAASAPAEPKQPVAAPAPKAVKAAKPKARK